MYKVKSVEPEGEGWRWRIESPTGAVTEQYHFSRGATQEQIAARAQKWCDRWNLHLGLKERKKGEDPLAIYRTINRAKLG